MTEYPEDWAEVDPDRPELVQHHQLADAPEDDNPQASAGPIADPLYAEDRPEVANG